MAHEPKKKISFFGILFYPMRLLIKTAAWFFSILIIVAFIVPAFIPVEKIVPIPAINAAIQEKTGLVASLNGKTRLSLLPFVGIVAHNVQLINEHFEAKEVLNAKKIDIKISVFPILAGKIIVKHIDIDEANINILQCNEKFNFFSPQTTHATPSAKKAEKPHNEKNPSMLYIRDISLTNFSITDSNISYSTCNSNVSYRIEKFNANISMPNFQSPLNANISFFLNGQSFDLTAKSSNIHDILQNNEGKAHITLISDITNIVATAKYKLNMQNPTFFEHASLELKATDISLQNAMKYASQENTMLNSIPHINITMLTEITGNSVKVNKADISLADISITAKDIDINISEKLSAETISTSGVITATASNIQNILNSFKVNVPNIAKYPTTISMPIYFSMAKGILTIEEQSHLSIDNRATINFSATINTLFSKKSITTKISSNLINVDEYIKFKTEKKQTEGRTSSFRKKSENLLANLPKEVITLFDTNATTFDLQVDIQKLITKGITVQNISSNTKAKNGVIINNTSAEVFDGKIRADIKAQEADAKLKSVALNADLQNIEIGYISTTLNPPSTASGKVKANLSFTANETNLYAIAARGSGKLDITTTDLAIKGIDVDAIINDIKTDYKKLLSNGGFIKYLALTKKSTIDQLLMQSTINNGTVKNNKFFVKKDKVSFSGSGKINLTNSKLQYYIKIFNKNEPLPYIVLNGKLDDISYSINPKAFILHQTKKGIQSKALSKPEVRQTIDKFNNLIGSFKK